MTATLGSFSHETKVGTGFTTLVSTTESETKFLGKVVFTNTSALPVEVTVWRILTATTPVAGSGGNWSIKKTIQPGKDKEFTGIESQVLDPSMSLIATAGTAGVINADISGVTES